MSYLRRVAMIPKYLYNYFIPSNLRNTGDDRYDQLCTVVTGFLVTTVLLIVLATALLFYSELAIRYYLVILICILTLVYIKLTGKFMFPLICTMILVYTVIIVNCLQSGGILSTQVSVMYVTLLTGFWADRRVGKWLIAANVLVILSLYSFSDRSDSAIITISESLDAALGYHIAISVFFGIFFLLVYQQYDEAKLMVKEQQNQQIFRLNEAVEERTNQLLNMRQTLARDFHDETGNLLSAITRQAGILKLRTEQDSSLKPLIDNIILNSEQLYASSRDFLWSINHNSDDPDELLAYLTAFGQVFYNQFDIAFSVRIPSPGNKENKKRLAPFVARHIISIFKEAITNTVKHSGANEVVLEMSRLDRYVRISLEDNGRWKDPDGNIPHEGISNMQQRSIDNDLFLDIYHDETGTKIQIDAPVTPV